MLSWRQRPAAANSRRARPRTERPDTRAPEPPPPPPPPPAPAAVSPLGAAKTMYYMHGGVVYAPAPQRIALATWQIPDYTPPPPPLPPPARPAGPCHAFSPIPTQAQLIGMQDDLVAVTRHAFAQHALHADNAPGDVFRRVANDVLAWIAAAVRRVHPDVRTRVLLRLMGVAYVHIDMVAGREVDGPAVRAALLDAQITSDLDFGCGHEPAWAPPPPRPPPPVVSADTAAVLLPQRLHSSYAAAAAAAASTRRPATTAAPAEQFALGTGTWPIGPPPPPPPLVAPVGATL